MDSQLKESTVSFMGGQCILCGYKRCIRALHFHHINPQDKKFEISKGSSWYSIENELKKCVLLCSNCHAEVHSGMIDHELLVELSET